MTTHEGMHAVKQCNEQNVGVGRLDDIVIFSVTRKLAGRSTEAGSNIVSCGNHWPHSHKATTEYTTSLLFAYIETNTFGFRFLCGARSLARPVFGCCGCASRVNVEWT